MATPAQGAWHPDPYGGGSWRWWDGTAWSERTAPADPGLKFDRPLRDTPGAGAMTLHRGDAATTGELFLGDARVAHLHKPGIGDGSAHCSEGSWYLDRPALQQRIEAQVLPSRTPIARFQWGGGGFFDLPGNGGVLQFTDGRAFPVRKTADLWGGPQGLLQKLEHIAPADWTFVDQQGVPLLRTDFGMPPVRHLGHVGASEVWVEVYPAAAAAIELPVMVLVATLMSWAYASSNEARRNTRD